MCVCVCLLGMSEPACRSEAERVEAQSGAPRGAAGYRARGGTGAPAPGAAGGRVAGQKRGGRQRWRCPCHGGSLRPEAAAGARCECPGRPQARYRCGFGSSSRFPPRGVQLPVMLSPVTSFLCL